MLLWIQTVSTYTQLWLTLTVNNPQLLYAAIRSQSLKPQYIIHSHFHQEVICAPQTSTPNPTETCMFSSPITELYSYLALVTPLHPAAETKPAAGQEGVPFTVERRTAELSRRQQPLPVYSFQSVVKKWPLYMIMPCSPERHKKSIKCEICMKLTPITCCCRGNSALLETGAVCAWDWNEHASVQRVLSKDEPHGTFTTQQVPQHKFGELLLLLQYSAFIYRWIWDIHLSNGNRTIILGSKRTFQWTVLKRTKTSEGSFSIIKSLYF